nr:MAG TPA: hypothetical protein [Caudoviricetes sp.]
MEPCYNRWFGRERLKTKNIGKSAAKPERERSSTRQECRRIK